jgi:hypothetical protein
MLRVFFEMLRAPSISFMARRRLVRPCTKVGAALAHLAPAAGSVVGPRPQLVSQGECSRTPLRKPIVRFGIRFTHTPTSCSSCKGPRLPEALLPIVLEPGRVDGEGGTRLGVRAGRRRSRR